MAEAERPGLEARHGARGLEGRVPACVGADRELEGQAARLEFHEVDEPPVGDLGRRALRHRDAGVAQRRLGGLVLGGGRRLQPDVEDVVRAARVQRDPVMIFVHPEVHGAVVGTLDDLHAEDIRGEGLPRAHVADADAEIRELRDGHGLVLRRGWCSHDSDGGPRSQVARMLESARA